MVLAEGHRMVIDTYKSGAKPHTLMFTQRALKSPLGKVLDEMMLSLDRKCSICEIQESVMTAVTETETNQGIIVAFEKPSDEKKLTQLLTGNVDDALLIVLDEVRDPGNMGTLIRTSYGLGADALVAVSGCDIWSSKVIRSATGVQLLADTQMPVLERDSWEDIYKYARIVRSAARAQAKDSDVQIVIADSNNSQDAVPYYEVDFTLPTVIVIGSEATGVSEAAYNCPGTVVRVTIPMTRPLDSFNAGVAGAVVFAEAARQRHMHKKYN